MLCFISSLYTDEMHPPLTEQHVLNAFKGSGITIGQVMKLGILLDIPRDKMEVIKLEQRDDPVMCAVLTINKWQKQDPQCEDLQYSYKRLENALRQCHQNHIIPRLHNFNECKEIGLFMTFRIIIHDQ